MNRIDENNWPTRLPSANFVDVTVERLLENRVLPTVNGSSHHRLAWLLVAALLVSGVAFGVTLGVLRQGRTRQVPSIVTSVSTMSVKPVIRKAPPVSARAPLAPVPKATEASVPTKPRLVKKLTVAVPQESVSSATPPAPKVPPCGCERGFGDYMCDCY